MMMVTDGQSPVSSRPMSALRLSDSLVKLAGFESTPYVPKSRMVEVLEPGDIIFTSPEKKPGRSALRKAWDAAYGSVSGGLQGKFTHAAIYTGEGKLVESRVIEGVRHKELRDGIKGVDIVVVRPDVDKERRQEAADFALRQVGKDYNALSTVMLGAGLVLPERVTELISKGLMKPPKDAKAYACSELIAAAYDGEDLTDVGVALAAPIDLLHTNKGTAVARSRFEGGTYHGPRFGREARSR